MIPSLIRRTPFTPVLIVVAFCFAASLCLLALTRLEEADAFCASCHSQPEATYVARTQTPSAIDLASWHAMLAHSRPQLADTRCIDCHAGPGVLGRASALALGARDAFKWFTGTSSQPSRSTFPISDANCLKCHATVSAASGFDNHFHHELARWQRADATAATCATCHTAHTTDGNTSVRFLTQSRAQGECKRCHVALGVEH